MATITKDLGIATAYGYAKAGGYTGTEQEFAELMASYAQVAQDARESADAAAESERKAKGSEDNAADSAKDAESWAVGQRDGADIPDTDPAFNNNAKYYAGQAEQMKEQTAVEARKAEEAVGAAEGHERAAEQAKEDAEAAAQEAAETVVAAQGPGICYVDSEGIPFVLE